MPPPGFITKTNGTLMTMCTYCISHKLKSKLLAPTDYNQNADYFISEIYTDLFETVLLEDFETENV